VGVGVGVLLSSVQDVELGRTMVDMVELWLYTEVAVADGLELSPEAGVEAMGVLVEAALGVWVECTSAVVVGYADEAESDLEIEADGVADVDAVSEAETWIEADEVSDSEVAETSCVLTEVEAEADVETTVTE